MSSFLPGSPAAGQEVPSDVEDDESHFSSVFTTSDKETSSDTDSDDEIQEVKQQQEPMRWEELLCWVILMCVLTSGSDCAFHQY